MTDQLPNNTQASSVLPGNSSMQGPPPSTATVLPDAPPPQDIAVDPIPLPSSSPSNMVNPSMESATSSDINIETVIEPEPVKMQEVVIDPVPEIIAELPVATEEELPESGSPVPEEDPSVIRPPQSPTDQSISSSRQHTKISKKVIAGIAGLVFLISGLSVGIYFNSQNFGVFDSRRYAADNMCNVSRTCTEDWQWREGWVDAHKKENEGAIPVRDEYTNANDDQSPADGVQAEIIRRAGETGVGDPGAGKRTGDYVTTAGGPTSGGATPVPTGSNVQAGNAGNCYGIGGGQAERDCLANAKNGQYSSGICRGKTVEECSKLGKPFYCSGSQEKAGTGRAGEFLSCGGSSTGGCGQIDIYAPGEGPSTHQAIGFVIDKSGCNGKPPETTTNNAPPRDLQPPTVPDGGTTATPTLATISAKCNSLVGQTKDNVGTWVDRSDAEFVGLVRAGDQVRFVCTGHKTQGNFTKAAFFINRILYVNDVIKLSTDKYAVPFTIPASGQLDVEAVLLHDTKGWVD